MIGFSWKREQVYFLRYSNVNSTVWCSWWSCSTRNVGFFSGSWTMASGFRLQLVEFFVCLPWQTYSSVSCKFHREMQTCTSAAASAVSLILLLVAFRKYTRTTCYGVHIWEGYTTDSIPNTVRVCIINRARIMRWDIIMLEYTPPTVVFSVDNAIYQQLLLVRLNIWRRR